MPQILSLAGPSACQTRWLCWALLGVVVPLATADEALREQIRPLVQRLNAREATERDGAEQALMALGPQALRWLPVDNDQFPAEVRHRLERVRSQLQRQSAQTTLEPTQVTLQGESLELTAVFAAIHQQTGNRLIDRRGQVQGQASRQQINLELQHVDFWPALDEILDRAGLDTIPLGEGVTLAVGERGEARKPRRDEASDYIGPLRVAVTTVTALRNLRENEGDRLRLGLEIAWEPRLKPVAILHPAKALRVVDDQQRSVSVADLDRDLTVRIRPGMDTAQIVLDLTLPEWDASGLARIKGEIGVIVPGVTHVFHFVKLEDRQPKNQREAGATVFLDTFRRNGDIWEARMRVRFEDGSNALNSQQGWVFDNSCHLIDPEGNKIHFAALEATSRRDNEVGVAYLFPLEDGPEGYELIYQTPVSMLRSTLAYSIEDIPLPSGSVLPQLVLLLACTAPPPLVAAVAAYVGDDVIEAADVERLLVEAEQRFDVAPSMRPRLAARLLERLVDDALVRRHLSGLVTPRDLRSRLQRLEQELAARGESLQEWMRQRSLDQQHLEQELRWEIGRNRFFSDRLSPQRLEAHYTAHRRSFDGTRLRVAHILLRPAKHQTLAAVRKRAAVIRDEIVQHRLTFAEAARRSSIGATAEESGELGWIPRQGVMTEAFSRAAFALQPGEISAPVETPHGVHIIECREEEPGAKRLSDVTEAVRRSLKRQLFAEIARQEREQGKVRYTGAVPYLQPATGELVLP